MIRRAIARRESHGCHDKGKENGNHAGSVIEPASKCGIDRNAAQGKSSEKDPELERIHTRLVDREESQVGAGTGKQDGDGDG
jgi:hypothetical protein